MNTDDADWGLEVVSMVGVGSAVVDGSMVDDVSVVDGFVVGVGSGWCILDVQVFLDCLYNYPLRLSLRA